MCTKRHWKEDRGEKISVRIYNNDIELVGQSLMAMKNSGRMGKSTFSAGLRHILEVARDAIERGDLTL